ncbi:hypothetical protein RP20_CCG017691 [Aedes albopictus]|nr:hypothetical protein RP20_CCG017691 [Aedes albopictus]
MVTYNMDVHPQRMSRPRRGSSVSSGFRLLDADQLETMSSVSRNSICKLRIDAMFDDTSCLIFIQALIISAKFYPCDRKLIGSTCYAEESHATVMFEDARRLVIEHSAIPTFSEMLFHNLPDVESITLKGGNISAVNFSSDTLTSLRIDKTGLQNLSITPEPNHSLNTLLINRNYIATLPKSIRYLYALSILDLSQNRIEYINLDWFQQMNNLLVLDLSWNRIARIDASSELRLSRLKNFFASYNHLSQIPWFPIGFPKLERIRLAENYWNCAWVASMRKQIWDRRVRLFDSDGACSANSEGGLCCYDQVPVDIPARYELIEIEFQEQADGVIFEKKTPEPARMMLAEQPADGDGEEKACGRMRDKIQSLKRELLALVKQKAEMEQQYSKKVAAMQETLRSVREDLEAAEQEVTRYRYKERMDMIDRTGKINGGTEPNGNV